jgi:hypothetical protein
MKRGAGKGKGSAYERHVRDILTAAYYPDGGGMFSRIYSHPIPKKGEVQSDLKAFKYVRSGDPLGTEEKILVVDNSFPFSVECKNYKGVKPLFCGLYSKESEVWSWMRQAVCARGSKIPLVVFRLFHTADVAVLRSEDFSQLRGTFGLYPYKSYVLTHTFKASGSSEEPIQESLVFLLLKDFLEWIDWGVFRVSSATQMYIRSLVPKSEVGDGKGKGDT